MGLPNRKLSTKHRHLKINDSSLIDYELPWWPGSRCSKNKLLQFSVSPLSKKLGISRISDWKTFNYGCLRNDLVLKHTVVREGKHFFNNKGVYAVLKTLFIFLLFGMDLELCMDAYFSFLKMCKCDHPQVLINNEINFIIQWGI